MDIPSHRDRRNHMAGLPEETTRPPTPPGDQIVADAEDVLADAWVQVLIEVRDRSQTKARGADVRCQRAQRALDAALALRQPGPIAAAHADLEQTLLAADVAHDLYARADHRLAAEVERAKSRCAGSARLRNSCAVNSDGLVLRRATDSDATGVADVWLRSFAAALPTVRRAHDDADVRGFFADVVVPHHETWVADDGGTVVGLLVLDDGQELEQLYLDPSWRGRGLGDRFVDLAKRRRPDGLGLWTFQVNLAAQRFYRRHGFVEVERTDGAGNEEREPDVRFIWLPEAR
ncbi:ribosomal protein S18 acetylase RimI-like enzyme [Catenulispora sp. GAS73]